jgi:hypothetical protein
MLSSVNSPYWLVSAATLHTTTRLKACTGRCLLRVKISCRDCRGEASAGPQKAAELVRCSAFVGAGRCVISRVNGKRRIIGSFNHGWPMLEGDVCTGR